MVWAVWIGLRVGKLQIPRLRSEVVAFVISLIVWWPESCEEHRPTSILGVLRLRALNPLSGDSSARRFAQDDGLVGVLKNMLVGCTKTREIKKVTTSQDDVSVGGLKKNIPNKLALM